MKLVFGGTAKFAVPSLVALTDAGHEISLLFTQPDRPTGRGRERCFGPVKQAALEIGIPVFQPENLRSQESLGQLMAQGQIDAAVVVAYGQKIPRIVLEWPILGVINVHGSLLPKYRGAAPIQRAVMNGEAMTGVTTMLMDEGWDTGDILLQEELEILPDETAGDLAYRLAQIGAKLLVETLEGLERGCLQPIRQDEEQATYAPSLVRDEGYVDWSWPSARIANTIRGCSPSPGAFSLLDSTRVKLWRAISVDDCAPCAPGKIVALGKEGIDVAAGEGCVRILELQADGKKRVPAADFARGVPGLSAKTFVTLIKDG